MKAISYLLSGLLITPGALLAYYVWTVSQAIRQGEQGGLFKVLLYLLIHAVRMLEWGIYLIAAALVIWITLAFVPKYRWVGAIGMAVIALVSLVEFFVATGAPKTANDLSLPILSVAGLALNLWLVWDGVLANSAAK
jgi:hypothetical protein